MMTLNTKKNVLIPLFLAMHFLLSAATFNSVQSGDWNDSNTWAESGTPSTGDDVFIHDGHSVMLDQKSSYTHLGDITVYENGTLIANTGNSSNGFNFNGNEFHVFGQLTLPFPDKDFKIIGNSLFWGHPSAVIFVSDDWIVTGNTETIVEGICVEVDDDFHINGPNATVCGGGGVSIGSVDSKNTFNLLNGATTNQICLKTIVYRGVGGDCTTVVASGGGNEEPTAIDDQESTYVDTPISIDVLDLNIPDSDPDAGQIIKILSVGNDPKKVNGITDAGGTVSINNNGTNNDPSDDFVDYQPSSGFIGTDFFFYIITDQNGGYAYAEVMVEVNSALPISLVDFSAKEMVCEIVLNWVTESEINNDFFEIEKSNDGITFQVIEKIDGGGNSSLFRNYRFIDELPGRENYYRLKQTDFDGQFTYSDVIFVASNCIQKENIGIVTLFPNPAIGSEVNLRFNANDVEASQFFVTDLYGQVLFDRPINIEKGMNNISIDIETLPAGSYFIHVGKKTSKFIKVRD